MSLDRITRIKSRAWGSFWHNVVWVNVSLRRRTILVLRSVVTGNEKGFEHLRSTATTTTTTTNTTTTTTTTTTSSSNNNNSNNNNGYLERHPYWP